MGYRHSKEELSRLRSLVDKGLTSREIALRFGRSEAAIRNIRYRLRLPVKIQSELKSLACLKGKVQSEIDELNRAKALLTKDMRSLEGRRKELASLLNSDEESLKKKIEGMLIRLKIEQPQLFYISGEEQIGKLIAQLAKWLFS